MKKIKEYKRMFETRNVRPYYTIPHLGCFGARMKKLSGFEYKNTIYVTSATMNNKAYFEVNEMREATNYFRKLWDDGHRTAALLKKMYEQLEVAKKLEQYGWRQNWQDKTDEELLTDSARFLNAVLDGLVKFIVSQPQHVISLEEKLSQLIEKNTGGEKLIRPATYFPGDLPWAEENRKIKKLNIRWRTLSHGEQEKILEELVKKYGWFNEIEGDQPFNKEHYRQQVVTFKQEEKNRPKIRVPNEIRKVGHLIGELGFLRFWGRYHFMTLRYHLKKILDELIKRSKKTELEFATIDEINKFFSNRLININKITQRQRGYASFQKGGEAKIVTGTEADKFKGLVRESFDDVKEIKGKIANRGKVKGIVRIISFSDNDYNNQVASFKKGEILVASNTKPQIVHLCRLAAAIITDEGGITSHAAVVSREFGIPCIIGTHNATKILKTGDYVEVDANKGVVRIINK